MASSDNCLRRTAHCRRRTEAHDARRDAGHGERRCGLGVRPWRRAASEAMSVAHDPSLSPEALPAVTVPSGRDASAWRAIRASSRGCSSRSTIVGSPFSKESSRDRLGDRPAAIALARSGCAARARPGRRARRRSPRRRSRRSQACCPPYFAFVSGLTKRHPSVVSSASRRRMPRPPCP